jgi:hypothetical protein
MFFFRRGPVHLPLDIGVDLQVLSVLDELDLIVRTGLSKAGPCEHVRDLLDIGKRPFHAVVSGRVQGDAARKGKPRQHSAALKPTGDSTTDRANP